MSEQQRSINGSLTGAGTVYGTLFMHPAYDNVRTFDTVEDMQDASDLSEGAVCHTLGFHSAGDGGAAWYRMDADGTANGMDVIACVRLNAHLVVSGKINAECFGTHNSPNKDDYAILQYAINKYPRYIVLDGDYYISHGLTIPTSGVVEGVGAIHSSQDCFTLENPGHIEISGLRLYPQRHGIYMDSTASWANYNTFRDLFIYGSYNANDQTKQTICGIMLDRTVKYMNEQTFINCVCWNFAYGIYINNPDRTQECSMHRFINCSTETSKISGQYIKNSDLIIFENCRHVEAISNLFTTVGTCNHLIIIGGTFDNTPNVNTMSEGTSGIILGSFRGGGVWHEDTGQIAYIVHGKVVPIFGNVYNYRKQLVSGDNYFPEDTVMYKNIRANAPSDMTLHLDDRYYGGNGKINELFICIPANGNKLTILWGTKMYTLNATASDQFICAKCTNILYSPEWFFIPMQKSIP